MPWEKLPDPSNEDKSRMKAQFGRKAPFLVDENLEGTTTEVLRTLGWNTKGVSELKLVGHSDEDVLATAWREDRMLITNDDDFLDDYRFPEHSNPGVIMLPDTNIESDAFLSALRIVLSIFGPLREAYRRAKIIISTDLVIKT
jgi:predicted nuclease of predicted toxin-antitoxin system